MESTTSLMSIVKFVGQSLQSLKKGSEIMGRWIYPLDDECPEVEKYHRMFSDDPFMAESGCAGEFYAAFAKRHRASCVHCQEYGAANVDVEY